MLLKGQETAASLPGNDNTFSEARFSKARRKWGESGLFKRAEKDAEKITNSPLTGLEPAAF